MKFNVAKGDLASAVNTVLKGMASRSTLPILSGILVNATDGGEVVFETTDLDISIRHIMKADVVETGKTVLPGKLFADIVKALPDAAVGIEATSEAAKVACLGTSYNLTVLNPVDFPYFPEVAADTVIAIDPPVLQSAVSKVAKSVSRDESRAIFTGILFSVEGGKLRLVSTDSYRLAVVDLDVACGGVEDFQAVVPGRNFEDVARLAAGEDNLSIGFAENQIVFNFGPTTFVSRKIEGTYPNYKQLLPESHEVGVKMDTRAFVTAIKRVSLLAQSHTPVHLQFSEDSQNVVVSASTKDVGASSELLDAAVEGGDIEIGFNHQYLLDGLSSMGEETALEMQGPLKACIMRDPADDSFLYLILPVRI